MENDHYYIWKNGEKYGPYSKADLQKTGIYEDTELSYHLRKPKKAADFPELADIIIRPSHNPVLEPGAEPGEPGTASNPSVDAWDESREERGGSSPFITSPVWNAFQQRIRNIRVALPSTLKNIIPSIWAAKRRIWPDDPGKWQPKGLSWKTLLLLAGILAVLLILFQSVQSQWQKRRTEEKINQLKTDIKATGDSLQWIDNRIGAIGQEISSLREAIQQTDTQIAEKEKDKNASDIQKSPLEKTRLSLRNRVDSLQGLLDDRGLSNRKRNNIQNQIGQLNAQLQENSRQFAPIRVSLDATTATISALQKQKGEQETQLTAREQERLKFVALQKALQTRLKNLVSELRSTEATQRK